jgi:hypothetical protein
MLHASNNCACVHRSYTKSQTTHDRRDLPLLRGVARLSKRPAKRLPGRRKTRLPLFAMPIARDKVSLCHPGRVRYPIRVIVGSENVTVVFFVGLRRTFSTKSRL